MTVPLIMGVTTMISNQNAVLTVSLTSMNANWKNALHQKEFKKLMKEFVDATVQPSQLIKFVEQTVFTIEILAL